MTLETVRTDHGRFASLPDRPYEPRYKACPDTRGSARIMSTRARVMPLMHGTVRGRPDPMRLPEAGHFAQEWGEQVARAAPGEMER